MKGKQIAILLVLLVIIGGVAFFLQKRNQSEWTESATRSEAKVLDFPINDVTRVVIHAPNGQVQLAKKNDVWVVEEKANYPANFERVSGLIRSIRIPAPADLIFSDVIIGGRHCSVERFRRQI